ncbi:SagB/ThcOx family dehydrogenase [Desulfobacterales bacterium HSG2]|nr:SagB/ThcOx family dehydrogenase [Desulfobacterales bacterium HSG2]
MSEVTRRGFISAAAGSTALAVLKPSALFAATKPPTQLPPPSSDAAESLISALKNRKTTRTFSEKPLPQQMLSDLLWAAFGVSRPDSGKRTAPSAKNQQEIDIYVATADGLYLYDANPHQLVQLSAEDIRPFCGKQKFVAGAPVNLVYVADFSKMGSMGEDEKVLYSAADTGFISQNVYLFCAAKRLATVVRGWIDKPALSEKINLRKDQRVILAQTVGYPK